MNTNSIQNRTPQKTRNLPIEQITPLECRMLLSHCCGKTPAQHKAYWEKWFNWFKSTDGQAYDAKCIECHKKGIIDPKYTWKCE